MLRTNLLYLLFTILISTGCSSGTITPLSPDDSNIANPGYDAVNGVAIATISDFSKDGTPSGIVSSLGIYEIAIDTEKLTGEITPRRQGTLEDVLEIIDISGFMSVAPCIDCVDLKSILLNADGNLVLNIGLKHPFPVGIPSLPITGKNRADLHVFNVEGTIVSDGSSTPQEFPGIGKTVGRLTLLNADGYSGYLDSSLDAVVPTTADIHPYILHFDDYTTGNFSTSYAYGFQSVTNPGPSGNLVMRMGSGFDYQEYIFQIDGGEMTFTYVIACTYAISAGEKRERFDPEYRVPQHNKKAASEVKVEVIDNTLKADDIASSATIHVKILDMNHGIPVGTSLDQMLADSSVSSISVDVQYIMSTPITVNSPVEISGTHRDPLNPLTYEITFTNSGLALEGIYTGLVKVLDSYPPGLNTNPLLDNMDGIKRVEPADNPLLGLFAISEFATYQTFEVEVIKGGPICIIETTPDPPEVEQGIRIEFDGSLSEGGLGSDIISYEWDYDYDGENFDTDDEGAVVSHVLCRPGLRDVALQVTDANMDSTICTVEVMINEDVTNPTDGWGTDQTVVSSISSYTLNVGNRGLRVYDNDIYIAFYSTNNPQNAYFVKSEDYGLTWKDPIAVTSYTAPYNEYLRGCLIWVDSNTGDIYYGFQRQYSDLTWDTYLTRSQDRGDTWVTAIKVNPYASGGSNQLFGSLVLDDSVNPSRIYVSYVDQTVLSNHDVKIASTTTSNWQNFTIRTVDDSAIYSRPPSIYVSPVDQSLNVAWCNPYDGGGDGTVLFDRSTDGGLTFGTDVVVYTHTGNYGPYEPALVVQPVTGIPGILARYFDSTIPEYSHGFFKADNPEGTSWSEPVILVDNPIGVSYAGALECTADGHWVTSFKESWPWHRILFAESFDDGETWLPLVEINDNVSMNRVNPQMALDDCGTIHICWTDQRTGTYQIMYDSGT